MRIFDWQAEKRLRQVALYLTLREAQELHEFLTYAIKHPNVEDHIHVFSKSANPEDELSCEILTERKLRTIDYSATVRRLCRGWKDEPAHRNRSRKK